MKKIFLLTTASLAMLMADFTLEGDKLTPVSGTITTVTDPASPTEPAPTPAVGGIIPNSVDEIWADSYGENTGWVSNMPSGYKQFQGPTQRDWSQELGQDWNNLNIWCEVEAAGDGSGCSREINKATNTRVEVAWMGGYALYGNTWTKFVGADVMKGGAHPHSAQENFPWEKGTKRCSKEGDHYFYDIQIQHMDYVINRIESNGLQSFKPKWYYRWHGWAGRGNIDKSRVRAIFGEMYVRLVVEDPSKPDDRHLAKYVVHIASDKYAGTCGGTECYRGDLAISRYKMVTNEWQPVSILTGGLTKAELAENPPPFSLGPKIN